MSDPTPPPPDMPLVTGPGELVTEPAPAAAVPEIPKVVTKCRMCVRNDSIPGLLFCVECKARRDAAAARVAVVATVPQPSLPTPVVRTGVARLMPPNSPQSGQAQAPRPRVLPPPAEGRKCIQCPKVMSEHPDQDDTPSRCGSCIRKNREQLRAFARGEG